MSIVRAKARPRKRGTGAAEPIFTGAARPHYRVPDLNVLDAALERIRWVFEEFDGRVMVSNSGGKDSTVVVELAAIVAAERGELPLRVHWLDQECEFASTVEYQRYLMYERDDIDFAWYQIPFRLENSTNHDDPWLHVWDPALRPEEWARPKEPAGVTITENVYGEDHFYDLLSSISSRDWDGAILDGIRSEESPARRLTSTSAAMYKWCTWVGVDSDPKTVGDPSTHRFRFHPIYDWSYRDVWKAIHEHGWRYNAHYDHLFSYGVPTRNMRVSNYHHEMALASLHHLQEIEPETWEAATRRLQGINAYGQLKNDQYPDALPYMFASWREYVHHLIDHLVVQESSREKFRKQYAHLDRACADVSEDDRARVMVKAVIGMDEYGTGVGNFMVSHRKRKDRAR